MSTRTDISASTSEFICSSSITMISYIQNHHYDLLHTTNTTISYIQQSPCHDLLHTKPSLRSPTYNHLYDLPHTTITMISYIQPTLRSPTYNKHYNRLHTTITMISYIQPSPWSPTYNHHYDLLHITDLINLIESPTYNWLDTTSWRCHRTGSYMLWICWHTSEVFSQEWSAS